MASEFPPLRHSSSFSKEYIASIRSHPGTLQGVVERSLRTLGFALTLIERTWADAKLPIDGDVVQIKEVDAALRKAFRAGGGNESDVLKTAKRLNISGGFAAVWIATPAALYYIIPAMGATQRWPWSDVRIRAIKIGRRFARVGLQPNESAHEYEARLAAWPAENLLAIADFYRDVKRGGDRGTCTGR